ncbi:MAG: hypothetical protein CMO80_23060 [Verrucomicrobiales bacterium]|nr:hypothetical protein [Verrucomicrobiales bacterium]
MSLPLVFLFDADPQAAEGGPDTAFVLVLRGGDVSQPLTVHYAVGGTAVNEVDYQPLLGSVTIPAGEFTAPIVITPIDDAVGEHRETVQIELTQPAAGTTAYRVRWPGRATVTILDNDGGVPSPPAVELANPPEGATFRGPLDLHLFAHTDDEDGVVNTVEFFANGQSLGIVSNFFLTPIPLETGTGGNAAGVSLDVINVTLPSRRPNPNTSAGGLVLPPIFPFSLTWENAQPGTYELSAVATDNAGLSSTSKTVNITIELDTTQPEITVFARDGYAAETDPTGQVDTATFVLRRSGSVQAELNVQFALSGTATAGVDYDQIPTSAIIPAGQREAEVTINPIDDAIGEPTESIFIELQPIACVEIVPPPADCYRLGRITRARARLADNDNFETNYPPTVSIFSPWSGSVHVEPQELFVGASAWDRDGSIATVEFFDGETSLGVVSNNTLQVDAVAGLSFLPPWSLTWSNISIGEHVLTAKAIDNEGAESVSRPVTINVVSSNPLPTVTIVAADAEASEPAVAQPGGGVPQVLDTARFVVTRDGPTDHDLVVTYRLDGRAKHGIDYAPMNFSVTIPAGQSAADIEILPLDDSIPEGPENVIVALTTADQFIGANGTAGGGIIGIPLSPSPYRVGQPGSAEAIILDNDSTGVNAPPEVTIIRPHAGSVHDNEGVIRIDALAFDPGGSVARARLFANGALIGEQNLAFILPPPPGIPHTFTFRWTNAPAGTQTLTVKVDDNGGTESTSPPVEILVIERPEQTVVSVHAVDPEASESGDVTTNGALHRGINTATFEIRREGHLDHAVTVFYRMTGTAQMGADYLPLGGEVRFEANETVKRVVLIPIDDTILERTETARLEVLPPVCVAIFLPPPDCYVVSQAGRATALIRDNDENRNRAPRVIVTNPRNGQRFTAPATVEIEVATRDRDGWVTQLEFFANNNKLGDSIIHFIDPPPPNQRQVFTLNWTNVVEGQYDIHARATDNLGATTDSHPVSITVRGENSLPIVNIYTRDGRASEEPDANGQLNTALFVLTRTGNTNSDVAVHLQIGGRAQNGTDYQTLNDIAVIPAGETVVPIEIIPIDDTLHERRESVIVGLTVPDTAVALNYELGLRRKAGAVIIDNDSPAPGTDSNIPVGNALEDGTVHVSLVGATGTQVVIEVSGNMIDWFELVRTTVSNGRIDFLDPEALLKRANFYRVIPLDLRTTAVEAQRRF